MPHATSLLVLLVVAIVTALVSRPLRIPYTVALVVAGLAIGDVSALSVLPLTKDVLFAIFLPGLLFEAAIHLEARDLWRDRVALVSLAVPGVIVAMGITVVALPAALAWVGVTPAMTPGFGTPAALLFAALISATDPVAVVSLFRALSAPHRLTMLVEGESLLNDGTAIIFFTLALAATNAPISAGGLVLQFVYVVGAGAALGAGIGLAAAQLIRIVADPMVEIMLTTIVAYGSFVVAEDLHASGVIATVTAGIVAGSRIGRRGLSATARVAVATFWEYVAFALNSVVFLLVGLTVRLPALLAAWRSIVAAYVVVMLARTLIAAAIAAMLPKARRLPRRWTAILSWGGLRGALSMVLALGIPPATPGRDTIVTITFGVVVLSILLQGVTIGPALRWLGVAGARRDATPYAEARRALIEAHAALQELERSAADADDATLAALRDDSLAHVRRAEAAITTADAPMLAGVPATVRDASPQGT